MATALAFIEARRGDESVVSIEGGVDERRGPSAFYIFALPKPGEEVADIREKIFSELGQSQGRPIRGGNGEVAKFSATTLCAVASQQCIGQRLAEFALYDSNPSLFDAELDHYLDVTATDIKNAVSRFIDVDNVWYSTSYRLSNCGSIGRQRGIASATSHRLPGSSTSNSSNHLHGQDPNCGSTATNSATSQFSDPPDTVR